MGSGWCAVGALGLSVTLTNEDKGAHQFTSSATNFKQMSSFYDMQPKNGLVNAPIPWPIFDVFVLHTFHVLQILPTTTDTCGGNQPCNVL